MISSLAYVKKGSDIINGTEVVALIIVVCRILCFLVVLYRGQSFTLKIMVRIALAGGTGGLGHTILDELCQGSEHTLFVFSRKVQAQGE